MDDIYTLDEIMGLKGYQEKIIEEADQAAERGDKAGVEKALYQLTITGFPIKKGFQYELLEKLGRANNQ